LLGLRALGFVGAEVAEPYQRDALHYLDEFSCAAETIGAANLIKVDAHGRLVGDNTRWLGFLKALRALVPSLDGLRPLIIGAGDEAASIVYALTHAGLPLTIVDERVDRAIDLVHRLRHVLDEHSFSVYRWPQDLERVAPEANLIVNATAIGRWPAADRSPWPDDLPIPQDVLVFDLVSWPSKTRFLCRARAAGAQTVSRLSLLVYEAALALEKWTGRPQPIDVLWRVVGETLLNRHLEVDIGLETQSSLDRP
jgi:shikimate dehydrogenase